MSLRRTLFLFILGLGVSLVVASFQRAPGYMDADYYFAGGQQLAQGQGLREFFLWNYLDDPQGLPHPSHAYWMPLASLWAALGMGLSGLKGFSAARIGFVALAACLPPITAAFAYSLCGRRNTATLSGLLAAFPAFYLPYLTTTDTFGLYMLLGVLWLQVVSLRSKRADPTSRFFPLKLQLLNLQPLWLGILAGLMHLARADGILWLLLSLIAVSVPRLPFTGSRLSARDQGPDDSVHGSHFSPYFSRFILCLLGYLLIMGPWMARNLSVFGTPLSPGGARTLWVTQYDELFAYPAALLTPQHWWSSGLAEILYARVWALGQNLQTALAVQGEIFLLPLILLGLARLRRDPRVQLGSFAWLLTLLGMTLVFPYTGVRGGFFHSGAALQPLFWAAAPAGLEALVEWGSRVRRWQPGQAKAFFRAALAGLAVLLTLLVVPGRLLASDTARSAWNESAARYEGLESSLRALGADSGEIVLVNNPPGYFIATGRPAVVIPYGNLETLLSVARRYDARYLLLEMDQIQGESGLYAHPGDRPGLHYLETHEQIHVFRIDR